MKQNRKMNPCLVSAAICMGAAGLLFATDGQDLIGIGLSWQKNVFVQEHWRDGIPVYVIANRTNKNQMLTASAWRGRKTLGGPWPAPAHSIIREQETLKLWGREFFLHHLGILTSSL